MLEVNGCSRWCRALAAALLVPLGAATFTGCGGGEDAVETASVLQAAEAMRSGTSFDYEPYESPEAMRRDTQVSVLGHVKEVSRDLVDMGPEYSGVVLISLATDEKWNGESIDPVTVMVYWPEEESIEAIQKGLPEGTRVAFFGDKASRHPDGMTKGGEVFEAVPQGLLLESESKTLISVWGESETTSQWKDVDTIDELRASLNLANDPASPSAGAENSAG